MKTEYKGYTIQFSENAETWGCYNIEFHHASLGKVKERIDKLHRELRKASTVECLVLRSGGYGNRPEFIDAKIVEYSKPIREKAAAFERVPTGEIVDHEVYASFVSNMSERAGRNRQALSTVFIDSEYNHQIMAEMRKLHDHAKSLTDRMNELKKTLKTVPSSEIVNLFTASDHKFEEGDV